MYTGKLYVKNLILLMGLSILSAVAIIPYAVEAFSPILGLSGMSPNQFSLVVFLQGAVSTSICAFLGIRLSMATGLGTPVLSHIIYREPLRVPLRKHISAGLVFGVLIGISLLAADLLVFPASVTLSTMHEPGILKSLLASLYGGIAEEILFRLFGINLVIWLVGKICIIQSPGYGHIQEGRKTLTKAVVSPNFALYTALAVTALLFSLGHMVNSSFSGPVSLPFALRIIILNSIGSTAFGLIYAKRSLVSAMVAHFITDIFVHILQQVIS